MEAIFGLGCGLFCFFFCLLLLGIGIYLLVSGVVGIFLLAKKIWDWSLVESVQTFRRRAQKRQEQEELREKLQAEQERAKAETEKLKAEAEKKWWEEIERRRRPSLWDMWKDFEKPQDKNP